jgi:segregation and condensation protein A
VDYRVTLETFTGPLDLLLYLVKRNEVDVRDIPIAEVLRQFEEYVAVLRTIDLEFAGDFVVMAGTLMEIKSRLVLPLDEEEQAEAEDPRVELVRQLVEYRRFKDAAAVLEERAARQAGRIARQAPEEPPAPGGPPPVRPVELWDLVSAFGRLMRETMALRPRQIVVDDTPQHVYREQLLGKLRAAGGSASFRDLFDPPHHRSRLIGLFLALLELIKMHRARAEQESPFAEIRVAALEASAEAVPAA